MPQYRYKARSSDGELISGMVEAPSSEAAGSIIDQKGHVPVSIQEDTRSPSDSFNIADYFGSKITSDDMVMLTFQMSTLLGAGIPLLTGLRILAKQISNKKLKKILETAARDIEAGSSLSESLAKHPRVFPPVYANMIYAGEVSGQLEEIFIRLGEMAEHDAEIREKIKTALRYPKMVLAALVVAFAIIMWFVIPRFVGIFEQFDIALPLPTKIMIGLNTIFNNYWFVCLIVVGGAIAAIRWMLTTDRGRYYWHYIQITMPILGPVYQKAALSRFTNMLGTLLQSGLPIIDNLHITSQAIGNDVIAEAIRDIRDSIQEGRGLAEPMGTSRFFTPIVVQMVSIGETTGQLDAILLKVSRYYDMEVDYTTKRLGSYIEPVLTLLLGLMVMFFAMAVFLPMWDMTKIAGR